MRYWERDLADHLILLMLMNSDGTVDQAVAELKKDLPSFPTEEVVRASYFEGLDSTSNRPGRRGH